MVPAGGFGQPVGGKIVSLFERSPAQLGGVSPAAAASFGLPDISRRGLASVVRQQGAASSACRGVLRDQQVGSRLAGLGSWAIGWQGPRRGVRTQRGDVGHSPPRLVDTEVPLRGERLRTQERSRRRQRVQAPARPGFRGAARRRRDAPPLDIDGVTGHGRLAFDDDRQRGRLAALFGSATCFVMPSFVEPFGITYVEAAAAGLPSIGTRVRGTTDSVGDGGVVVDLFVRGGHLLRHASPGGSRDSPLARRCRQGPICSFTWRKTAERVVRAIDPDSHRNQVLPTSFDGEAASSGSGPGVSSVELAGGVSVGTVASLSTPFG